jgi:serine phosphatase RsbU (regulator of sigma subunit)
VRVPLIEDLLEMSHSMAPDNVAGIARSMAEREGLHDLELYIVDYEQMTLVRVPTSEFDSVTVSVDSTVAGRAFISSETRSVPASDGERLWVPLLDGGERIGVLGVTVTDDTEERRRLCWWLASQVALLLVSKNAYTDQQELCRRTRTASLASELQLQILPPLSFVCPGVAISAVLEDAYETGGDAFDYAVNGSAADFAIFDAMGHGIGASLLAATVLVAYRRARRQRLTLEQTYEALDEVVEHQFEGEGFVTAHLGHLDIETGEFHWVNAGHPQPLIVRQGRSVATMHCEPSTPLGMAGPVVEVASSRLSPGDRLLFFSDGVVEAKAPDGEPFGEARLADNLQRESFAGMSPAETMRRLLHAVLGHQGSQLKDDASMLMVEWGKR